MHCAGANLNSCFAYIRSNGITTGTHIKEGGVTPSNSGTVTEKPLTSAFPVSVPASSKQRFLGRVGKLLYWHTNMQAIIKAVLQPTDAPIATLWLFLTCPATGVRVEVNLTTFSPLPHPFAFSTLAQVLKCPAPPLYV